MKKSFKSSELELEKFPGELALLRSAYITAKALSAAYFYSDMIKYNKLTSKLKNYFLKYKETYELYF